MCLRKVILNIFRVARVTVTLDTRHRLVNFQILNKPGHVTVVRFFFHFLIFKHHLNGASSNKPTRHNPNVRKKLKLKLKNISLEVFMNGV